MEPTLLFAQALNGIQLGVLLFLLSSGLTLVLGIMSFLNLSTGSIYMLGAYFAAAAYSATGSFGIAIGAGTLGAAVVGIVLEKGLFGKLVQRDHLDQVLASLGVILIINELVRAVWAGSSLFIDTPAMFSDTVSLFGVDYPSYRLLIIVVGAAAALALHLWIHRSKAGMLVRAGATHPRALASLGIDVRRLNTLVFGVAAAMAGLSGVMAAPLVSVQPGMGETVLILTLVVIVTGGIGSVRGAFYGAILIGMVDTLGRAFLPALLLQVLGRQTAQAAGPALASILIYLLMAAVLLVRPAGLLPVRHS